MKESIVSFEYKDLLESGVVLHILQRGRSTRKYKPHREVLTGK